MSSIDRSQIERAAAELWDREPALRSEFPEKSTYIAYAVAVKQGQVQVAQPAPGIGRHYRPTHRQPGAKA